MTDTLTISLGGLHSREVATLRRSVDTLLRNAEIRSRYKEMRRRNASKTEVIAALAIEYHVSEAGIDLILWPR